MKLRKRITTWVAAVLALTLGLGGLGLTQAYAAAGDVPAHDKSLIVNADGTYTLALNVKGDSEKDPQKVNVVVVFDTSSSMNKATGNTEVTYTTTDWDGGWFYQNNLYGLIDGEYRQLSRTGDWYDPPYRFWYNGTEYTGQRYFRQEGNQTRLQAAEAAVNNLAAALLAYNTQEGNDPDTVEMALVDFANTAEIAQAPTTSYSAFEAVVNSRNAGNNDRGTNWEAGLRTTLNVDFDDEDPTYVIFVSDGNPTFYMVDPENTRRGGTGQEGSDNISASYNQAVPAAQEVVDAGNVFYTIGIYGNVDRMQGLTTASGAPEGNYYSAEDTAALQEALAEILAKIETAGIGKVGISDGTTSSVTTTTGEVSHLLTVDENSYKYYRAGGTADSGTGEKYDSTANGGLGEEWDEAPAATFENGAVKWNIDEILENDVTYTVTFDCWPSQTTLDIVADIKNDPSSYDTLDENIKQYIDRNGNLQTNTTATLSYTDTRTGQSGSSTYDNPAPVQTTAVESLALAKEWENELDGKSAEPITLTVTRDGVDHHTVTLSEQTGWEASTYISIGIMRNEEVLEPGHDFTFTEPADLGYYWELQVPTIRPMLVDGTLTMLILKDSVYTNPDGAKEYTIDGKTYYVGSTGAANLTATNERRSTLDLTKAVDGPDADPAQTFPFTLNVVDSKAADGSADNLNSDYYVWFSVRNGDYVDAVVSGANKEMKDGAWTGYYYAPSGTDIVVNLKAGDNLRFINLPTGTTYTLAEGTLPPNYEFVSSKLSGGTATFSGAQTSTGTIQETNTNYTVTYTNRYDLSDVEITKVWKDNNNQDGLRPTAKEFVEYLVLKADGTDVTADNADKLTVTVDPENSNKYIAKWAGLDRFADGEEIAYTVEETEIEGYTTTGSPAEDKGTITNSHTPEVTNVTVTKVWDDSNNIGGIRPASIQAQLTADGATSGEAVTLSADNQWTYTWTNLPKYKDGKEIVYSADETTVPAGYTKSGPTSETTDTGTTFTVTNTYAPTPATASFPVQKVMSVPENLDGPADWSYTISVADDAAGEGAEAATATVTKAQPTATFGPYTYTAPGTYTYTVTEEGTVPGVTNDSAASTGKTVTVTVTDPNKDGKLVATATSTTDNPLTFTNTYSAGETTASFPVQKVMSVPENLDGPADWSYTISVADDAAGEGAEAATATVTKAQPTATFGPYTYTAPGTYTYTVTEEGTVPGVTNDADAAGKTVTVSVEDNGEGALVATASSTAEAPLTFTNTYSAGETTASFPVQKVMSVPENLDGPADWSYTISVADDAAGEGAEAATATVTKAQPTATFGPYTYTAPGTYTYTVTEEGTVPGVTNDADAAGKTVTVSVEDNGEGALVATASSTAEAPLTFTNTYSVEPVTNFELSAGKKLEVEEPAEKAPDVTGKYTLTLEPSGDEPAPMPEEAVDNKVQISNADGNGTATSFGKINYTKPGQYSYVVSEEGTVAGVENGTASYTVVVDVVDNGNGTMTASVNKDQTSDGAGQTTVFTNTYSVTPVILPAEDQFHVTKAITGTPLVGGAFKFTLSAAEGTPMPENTEATNDDKGNVTFGAITYTAPGTYIYTIAETNGGKPGYTYDSSTVTVTVIVSDNGEGALVAVVSYSDDTEFNNTYEASGDWTPSVKKELNGRTLEEGQFTFELVDENGKVIDTKTNDASGAVQFDTISYNESIFGDAVAAETTDEAGNDEAATTEEPSTDAAVPTEEPSTEENAEAPAGENSATDEGAESTEPASNETPVADVNADTTEPTAAEGEATNDGTAADVNADAPTDEGVGADATNPLAGFIGFRRLFSPVIAFADEAARTKTFTYTIREVKGDAKGYTYDDHEVKVTVTVTDNGDGKLTASPVYEGGTTFTNTYEATGATGEGALAGTKTSEKLAKDQFTFQLKDGNTVLQEVKNDADGNFAFEPLTYVKNAEKDETGEHKYTIVEVNDGHTGYTYDSHICDVTVNVTDNGDGTLACAVKLSDGEKATFNNPYKPLATSTDITGKKVLEGRDQVAGEFSFQLADAEGNVVATASNAADGTVTFKNVAFDKVGEYTYTVTEVKGSDVHVTYDESKPTVKVTVEDVNGQLKATVEGEFAFTFTNTYTNPGYVEIDPPVQKVIKVPVGTKPAAATFTFQMKAITPGAPMPEGTNVDGVKTITIDGAGSQEFGKADIDKPGTYVYEISEVKGDAKGYAYDTTVYTLTVKVFENDKGKLVKEEVYTTADGKTAEKVVFTNTFTPEPPVLPQTSDDSVSTSTIVVTAVTGMALLAAGAALRFRKEN